MQLPMACSPAIKALGNFEIFLKQSNCHQQLNIKNYRPNCNTVVKTIF